MKVLWLTFIPSPYRLSFFEELGKNCELTVLFERASSKTRKKNWNEFQFKGYAAKILPGITIGGYDRLCFGVCKYLTKEYDRVIISNPTSPTGILAAAILRIKGIPYIVESDGAFPTGRTGGIRQMLKRFVMAPAQLCLSTAKLHDQYYEECGVQPSRLRRYPFTSLYQADICTQHIRLEEKRKFRKKLGMQECRIVVTVGRFTYERGYGKGFDLLLQVAQKDPATEYYIIGDDPTDEFLRMKEEMRLDNVHFEGFKNKEELGLYYAAADLFVLLTRGDTWGLVVNEAMSKGLPVITTDRCVAGLELIKNGENGYIVPIDNVEQISQSIQTILENPGLCQIMEKNSLAAIQPYTFENMSRVHMAVFNEYGE